MSCKELSEQEKHEIEIHPDIMVYTVEGPLFFGAISAFDRALNSIHKDPKYLIIRFGSVPIYWDVIIYIENLKAHYIKRKMI